MNNHTSNYGKYWNNYIHILDQLYIIDILYTIVDDYVISKHTT